MTPASALYLGKVVHQRFRPRPHRLAYRVFWTLFDLDEIDGLAGSLTFFSRNRFNILSFHDRDFGAGTDEPLRAQIERHLADAGIDAAGGPIRVLTMPRVLGYVFNPISVWFCHRPAGELAAVLYEVTNTFGQRHAYLIPVAEAQAAPGAVIRQAIDKQLYVSPFITMDIAYDFRLHTPADTADLVVRGSDAQGPLIVAAMHGRRAELTDAAILRSLATHPLLTLKVVAGIHFEALKLWLKGVGLVPRPPAPTHPITAAPAETAARR